MQQKKSLVTQLSKKQRQRFIEEISEMLKKGVFHKVTQNSNSLRFLSSLFFVGKKNEGNRPVTSLRDLKSFIPYNHSKIPKMDGLYSVKFLL